MCRLLASAQAHQRGPAYGAKMKVGQLLNQKVQQSIAEKWMTFLEKISK